MAETGKCEVCNIEAERKCGGCHKVFYCSKEHQKRGWKQHKNICTPFKVCKDDASEPHVVATRDIKEGDLILQEKPLIWGPRFTNSVICLGCGNAVNSRNSTPCSKCGLPLCNTVKCQNNPSHIPECQYLVQRGEKIRITSYNTHPMYENVITLRYSYQKQFAPDIWEKLKELEKKALMYRKKKVNEEKNKETLREENMTDNEIMYENFKTNCCDVPVTTPSQGALFYLTNMFEHNCRANCYKTFSSEGHIRIVAALPIKKGDHLSLTYVNALWSTFTRQYYLIRNCQIKCNCERCTDITEFRTNFSALKCQERNCGGNVLPETFLEEVPYWECKKCKKQVTSDEVKKILKNVSEKLDNTENMDTKNYKMFLKRHEKLLSPNNFYMFNMNLGLCQSIGKEKSLEEVSNDNLILKIKLCQQVSELIQILAPAEKGKKGIVLCELYSAMVEASGRSEQPGFPVEYTFTLRECKKTLAEAIECLKHEPDSLKLKESRMSQLAKSSMLKLEKVLLSSTQ